MNLEGSGFDAFIDELREAGRYLFSTGTNKTFFSLAEGDSQSIPKALIHPLRSSGDKVGFSFSGSINAINPKMVKNVVPNVATPYWTPYILGSMLMGNAVTGEDAGSAAEAERAFSKFIGSMAGFNENDSGGIFTFGGTGTNLYAFRMGLRRCTENIYSKGLDGSEVIVGSMPAHFCHQTATSWLGLGAESYLRATSNRDQTTNLESLRHVCESAIERGKRIACIVGVGGTTSSMGIDDFSQIADLIDELVDKYSLDYRPHLHADSVIGWAYLVYSGYDFATNPLGYSEQLASRLQKVSKRIRTIEFCDSFGVDFHKTGFCPYNSSLFVARREIELTRLGGDNSMMTPIFHDPKSYNPGKYSFETSRSSANIIATIRVFFSIGIDGYRSILAHLQEMALYTIEIFEKVREKGIEVVNQDGLGTDVFLRMYPADRCQTVENFEGLSADAEMNEYLDRFYDYYTDRLAADSSLALISKSSAAFYEKGSVKVPALRIYLLNPNVDQTICEEIANDIILAKDEFDFNFQFGLGQIAR